MSVIYILLPLAVILASVALWAFVRAVKAGQFDDLDTPAHRILHDDDEDTKRPLAVGCSGTPSGGGTISVGGVSSVGGGATGGNSPTSGGTATTSGGTNTGGKATGGVSSATRGKATGGLSVTGHSEELVETNIVQS